MKRNMDLVRAILLAMEAHPTGYAPERFTIAGYDQDVIGHHIYLMAQGELVIAHDATTFGDASPIALPATITWKGHDFLDAVRNDTVSSKLKTHRRTVGSRCRSRCSRSWPPKSRNPSRACRA